MSVLFNRVLKKVSNNCGLQKPKLYPYMRQVARINRPRQMMPIQRMVAASVGRLWVSTSLDGVGLIQRLQKQLLTFPAR